MRYPRFKGHDWTEVTDYFDRSKKFDYNNPPKTIANENWMQYEDRVAAAFGKWLYENHERKVAIKICRMYAKKLYEISSQCMHNAPIWGGLCKIENDETFAKFFIHLLQFMWT